MMTMTRFGESNYYAAIIIMVRNSNIPLLTSSC